MKYFSPSYWFKLWVLSAPLFNDKTQSIYAKSIDNNQKIKDWATNNSNLQSINQDISFTNSSTNYQPYNLNEQQPYQNIDPFYQTYLNSLSSQKIETSNHKNNKKINKRIKKQASPSQREILKLNVTLIIDQNNFEQYQTSFQNIINELLRHNILIIVWELNGLVRNLFIDELQQDNNILGLQINPQPYGYFRLPIEIRWAQNEQSFWRNLELVLRTDNLYVEGFIVNNTYYFFDFRNINPNRQPRGVRDNSIPHLTQIDEFNNFCLINIRPDYVDLLPDDVDHRAYWTDIYQAFLEVSNMRRNISLYDNIRYSLGIIIIMTAESLRFWIIHRHIIRQFSNFNDGYILLRLNNQNPIYDTLISWSEQSNIQSLIINLLSNRPNINQNNETEIIRFLENNRYLRINNNDYYLRRQLIRILTSSLDVLSEMLENSNVRILLGFFIRSNLNNCNKNRRQTRELTNNNYWHEKFCDLKPQIDKFQGKITTITILEQNSKTDLKAGDIFVGTTEGLYLVHFTGNVYKANNINDEEVTSIKQFARNKFYATTKNGDVYFLRTDRIVSNDHLIGQILPNIKSSDLNKELKMYYDPAPKDDKIETETKSVNPNRKMTVLPSLKLGKINPIDNYNKIEFLGDIDKEWATDVVWGSQHNKNSKNLYSCFNNRNFIYFILNKKASENISLEDSITKCVIRHFEDSIVTSSMSSKQRFGLTWYWENNNYYLQSIFFQYAESSGWSFYNVYAWMKTGNGIRLYNDEDTNSKKIDYKNLEKELNLYYDVNLNEKIISSDNWKNKYNFNQIYHTFNLGKINPLNYQKIKFLGSEQNFKQSKISWGNEEYLTEKKINDYDDKSIDEIITNLKFSNNIDNDWNTDLINDHSCKLLLQHKIDEETWHSKLEWKICLGLSFYWENNNYYLQVLSRQYAYSNTIIFPQGGFLSTAIGNGIRLYNDEDTNSRKKRDVFNINNLKQNNKKNASNELKNVTKWTDDFTKNINHEQDLPTITNNSNYGTNNITNL